MNEKQKQMVRRFETAQIKMLKSNNTMKGGGQALENDYASAYKALMSAGLKPKLRGKYKHPG